MSRSTKLVAFILTTALAQVAVSQDADSDSEESKIRQVQAIGKQPSSRQLQSRSSNRGTTGGVLSRLFGAGGSNNNSNNRASQNRSTQNAQRSRQYPTRNQPVTSGGNDRLLGIGQGNNLPSPFMPSGSGNASRSGQSQAQSAPRPLQPLNSGGPMPLMDPEEREALLRQREAEQQNIPQAGNYDAQGNSSVETYSSGSSQPDDVISIERRTGGGASDDTVSSGSSRRATRRSLDELSNLASRLPDEPAGSDASAEVIVATPNGGSAPSSNFPSVSRKPIPGGSTRRSNSARNTEVAVDRLVQREQANVETPEHAQDRYAHEQAPQQSSSGQFSNQHNEVAATERSNQNYASSEQRAASNPNQFSAAAAQSKSTVSTTSGSSSAAPAGGSMGEG